MWSELAEVIKGKVGQSIVHPGIRTLQFEEDLRRDRGFLSEPTGRLLLIYPGGREWLDSWQGIVPRGWASYGAVNDDLERARRLGIQLSRTYTEALVTHPNVNVILSLGNNQVLDPQTYTHALRRLTPNRQLEEGFIDGQRKFTGLK